MTTDNRQGLVCTNCGSLVIARRVTPGSLGLEIGIWLVGLVLTLVLIGFIILLGAIGYSIWRLAGRYNACPVCGGRHLVPKDSPVGTELLIRHNSGPSA